tara:strand:+ start:2091 stop:3119 length:1029 start_codon:yes stop_codon:yes gene_type:complete
MNQKNLNVKNKNGKLIIKHLRNKKVSQIFKKFEKSFNIKKDFAVAVSGGPDSLSLAYLSKIYAIKYNLKAKFFIVDHRLRHGSTLEARVAADLLKKINIECQILKWIGKKPLTNIQSLARNKRYSLLVNKCNKYRINNLLLGHHLDDLFENFFIRMLRGSGLNGLISLDKNSVFQGINFHRPLLDFEKKDLIYLSKKVFNFFIQDPSNKNDNFKRTRVRNLINFLGSEGLDKNKFLLTISNLKDADKSIKFYVEKNITKNSYFFKKNNSVILNKSFFDQSHEVMFRSLTEVIKIIGGRYYPVRGKSLSDVIHKISSDKLIKVTLGGCFIEKVNQSIIISKEV